jgi:hypothetical protein
VLIRDGDDSHSSRPKCECIVLLSAGRICRAPGPTEKVPVRDCAQHRIVCAQRVDTHPVFKKLTCFHTTPKWSRHPRGGKGVNTPSKMMRDVVCRNDYVRITMREAKGV